MARKKKSEEISKEEVKKNSKKIEFVHAVGRRRGAVARVRLYPVHKEGLKWGEYAPKKGDILVNQKPIEEYFFGEVKKVFYTEPFQITNTLGKYMLTIKVEGGGASGQLGAVVHGIARALVQVDPKNRTLLKKRGLLTRDARVRERRKVGMGGKARRKKQSPKR